MSLSTFADFPFLNEALHKNTVTMAVCVPSAIQDQSIPFTLEGRECIWSC